MTAPLSTLRKGVRGDAHHRIPVVSLEDIRDLRQYIGGVISRRFTDLPAQEQDEMACEGIAIVYELHKGWDRARCPSFADYCSTYLWRRLISYWRREMRIKNGTQRKEQTKSGEQEWENVVSLEAVGEHSQRTGRSRNRPGLDQAA